MNLTTTVNQKQLLDILLNVGLVRPVFIWGAPGIGKSAIVEQLAEQVGLPCVSLLGSQLAPEDIIGVPQIADGPSVFCPPRMIARDEPYCLFLDELNACSQEVRADARLWLEWAAGHGIHPWVYDYIRARPDQLWSPPPKTEEPFSTPRSWHMLSDAIASYGRQTTDRELPVLAGGCLTAAHAAQFCAYVKQVRGQLSGEARQLASRAKELLLGLSNVSLEIAQMAVTPEGEEALPARSGPMCWPTACSTWEWTTSGGSGWTIPPGRRPVTWPPPASWGAAISAPRRRSSSAGRPSRRPWPSPSGMPSRPL